MYVSRIKRIKSESLREHTNDIFEEIEGTIERAINKAYDVGYEEAVKAIAEEKRWSD